MNKFILMALLAMISNSFAADRFTAKPIDCPPDGISSKCFDTVRFGIFPVMALTAGAQAQIAWTVSATNNGVLGTYEDAKRMAVRPIADVVCKNLGYSKSLSHTVLERGYYVKAVQIEFIDGVLQDLLPTEAFRIDSWSDGHSCMTIEPTTFERIRCQ